MDVRLFVVILIIANCICNINGLIILIDKINLLKNKIREFYQIREREKIVFRGKI